MCILSNNIQLVRLFGAVSVMHFLCCDCSEDRVALTTVRSPNKIDPRKKEKRSRLTDIENKLGVTSGKREGGRGNIGVGD